MENDFLTTIIKKKKELVDAAKQVISEQQLIAQTDQIEPKRPFLKQFENAGLNGVNIIAEVKRASPSKGIIAACIDPAKIAKQYEDGGAVAISVLTDEPFFKGSINDLKVVRRAMTLPVLRKEFIISRYQVYESAVMGADAILLIVRILSQQQLNEYLALSRALKMDVLVEVHSEPDLLKATSAGATLIGINNRNLSSFDTNIETAMDIYKLMDEKQIPVAASGISTRGDIEKNLDSGIHNFLVGESLMRADDPVSFLKALRGI